MVASADSGSVFVDELGDMNLTVQAAMLRAVEERTILPVGGTKSRTVS